MLIRTSVFLQRGQVVVMPNYEHPEVEMFNFSWGPTGLQARETEIPDGRILYCHPDDEQRVRDALALLQERS